MNAREFGEYLKKLREDAQLSIGKLASISGVSQPYISQIECGKRGIPSLEILHKLIDPLKVDHREFLIKAGYAPNHATWWGDDTWSPINSFLYGLHSNKKLHYKNRIFTDHDKEKIEAMMHLLFPNECNHWGKWDPKGDD